MLERVGIADAARRLDAYPHQLSGGMRQRVMIAMALLCEPELLIADEPTTALDVTIEAQIVDLLKELQAGFEGSVVLVSHSLGLISELADEVAVMYAGKVVEIAATRELFNRPSHPYTQALLACEIDPRQPPGGRLATIKGSLPDLIEVPQGCIFAPRCPKRFARCVEEPPLRAAGEGHRAACWLAGEA
jgi:peptide/nickel transport system ATP-binding protein